MRIPKIDAPKLLLALIILIFILGIMLAVYVFRSNPLEEAISTNQVINVLFVIEDNEMPLSTYVLMYYPATKRASIFDVPGQLGHRISKVNRVDRIDSVYDPLRINNYESEVEKLLGIEINFSMVITKENLISIIDILEGVEIFIPASIFYREDDTLVMFPSGMTILDGDKASIYATYSLPYEDSDIENFRRQRFFLSFLDRQNQMNKILSDSETAKLYLSFFKTGMSRRTLRLLFNELENIDVNRTGIQSVGGDLREVSGQMLIIPLWDGNLIKEVVRQVFSALTRDIDDYTEHSITIEVLNGTVITGRASRTAEILRTFGYDVVAVGNADRNDYENTLIIHRMGDDSVITAFGDTIRCTNIIREFELPGFDEADLQNYDMKADVTLILGRDFDGRYVTGE